MPADVAVPRPRPADQDRFRAALDSVLDQRRGRLVQDFRLRTPDGHFMWFALKARPVVGSDGEVYESSEPVWDEGCVVRARG